MRFIFVFLLILSFIEAKTPYEKGKELYVAKACYSCHGNKAEGMNKFPALANRAKGYMAYKLRKYRAKEADSQAQEMMITYAVDLTDEEIDNLTTFMHEYVDDSSEESYDYSFQTHGHGGS